MKTITKKVNWQDFSPRQGGADGSGDRGGGGDPEGRGGAGGKEEPDRARGTRCSWRTGDLRRWMVDDWPRRSRRDEGTWRSWWTEGPRWRGGSHGGVAGSKGRGGVRNSKAGGGDCSGNSEDCCRGGGRGRLGGSSEWSGGLGTVCAAHTHHKATPSTGSTSNRGL